MVMKTVGLELSLTETGGGPGPLFYSLVAMMNFEVFSKISCRRGSFSPEDLQLVL